MHLEGPLPGAAMEAPGAGCMARSACAFARMGWQDAAYRHCRRRCPGPGPWHADPMTGRRVLEWRQKGPPPDSTILHSQRRSPRVTGSCATVRWTESLRRASTSRRRSSRAIFLSICSPAAACDAPACALIAPAASSGWTSIVRRSGGVERSIGPVATAHRPRHQPFGGGPWRHAASAQTRIASWCSHHTITPILTLESAA